jgi:HD-GYP domain-containing protein (c-di-GMP phosphodiesterase class II)
MGGPQVFVMPLLRGGRVIGVVAAGDKCGEDPQISTFDTGLVEAAASQISPFLETTALYAEQHAMFMGTLSALTSAIDAKDKYTCGHSGRVAFLAAALAQMIGLEGDVVERVHIAGLVHDVGKIGVPEAVLCKAARLTDDEFNLVKEHPAIGNRILCGIPALKDVLPGVMHHHERWDGRGYPAGLKGDQIPLFARLIGIADTFDAMSSSRSYRAAMPRDKVLEEIRRCAGTQFDPELVGPFLKINLDEYDRMLSGAASAAL